MSSVSTKRRLGTAFVDGLYDDDGYHREKRTLEDKLANLVVPGVDAAMEAGRLLENCPVLWEEADLAFGDFDGEGKTDVLRTYGGKWSVSYGGTSNWQDLNTSE